MSASTGMNDRDYKYNVVPVVKPEYFEEQFWLLCANAEAVKESYDWHDNDITVCTHPRSGSHMTWNIIRYLLQGHTNKPPDTATENFYPALFRLAGSPQTGPRRVLYTHNTPCMFGSDSIFKTGNRKFVCTIRNPNDVVVSTYHLWSDMIGSIIPKEFPTYYNEFITNATTAYPCTGWYNHVKAWEEYAARNPDVPIMFQMYEDLVRKPKESTARMAKFLDIDVTDEFLDEIAEASKFVNMRKTKVDKSTDGEFRVDANTALYRKGEIGGWKNWLTVQNYELFQKVFPELSADMACKDKLIFT